MTLTSKEIRALAVEFTNPDTVYTGDMDFQLIVRFETSDHPFVAVSRMNHIAAQLGIPNTAGESLMRYLKDTRSDWRTTPSAAWIPLIKEWWIDHLEEYGYSGPPELASWKN